MRTVYLGTSDFAAAVLDRLAGGPHRPVLVVTRPDSRAGRGRALTPPPVAVRARELGIEVIQPERLHEPEVLERIAAAEPDVLCVCAYGVLIKEPLLSAYEILNVHPSLLPRWRGAAPVERAIMAGDEETGVSIMRLTAGLDSGPVCLQEREPIRPDDDYGTLSARLRELGGALLVRALDERPPFAEQDEAGVTYAHKIEARDRALDPTRPPEEAERVVRALRPHIGARLPLPNGSFLGVLAAAVDGETLAPAGGRVRTDGDRLLLDCNGGALELLEVQPPGARPMAAADWLRGRPDPALVNFWLDPRLPGRSLDELVELAISEWRSDAEWPPYMAALAWRGDEAVLAAARELSHRDDPRARAVAAYVLGQLGVPERTFPAESAAALEELEAREEDPEVLATIASAFGHLGAPHGIETLLRLRRHPDARVREGAADALAGRDDERVFDALVELTSDPEPGIRDWATFALGTLSPQDTPVLRDALAARLDDSDDDTRIEAVHGLALRGDTRALDAVLDLLGEVGPHDDGGNAADTIWKRYALTQATVRLAALTGDARLKQHLPALDERLVGTAIEPDLRRAYERVGDDGRSSPRSGCRGRPGRRGPSRRVAAAGAGIGGVGAGVRGRRGCVGQRGCGLGRARVRSAVGRGRGGRGRRGRAGAGGGRGAGVGSPARRVGLGCGRGRRRAGLGLRIDRRRVLGLRGGGGGGRDVVPGIVGVLGGRRVGDVAAAAVVLDAGVVLDHPGRRLGLLDDGRDVLARAGVGPGLLLGEVDGAVAVGVVLGVVDAVAVGVGLPRVRGRRELDAVAQAVARRSPRRRRGRRCRRSPRRSASCGSAARSGCRGRRRRCPARRRRRSRGRGRSGAPRRRAARRRRCRRSRWPAGRCAAGCPSAPRGLGDAEALGHAARLGGGARARPRRGSRRSP